MKKNITQEERLDYLVEEFKADSDEYRDLQTSGDSEGKRRILRSLMNIRMPKALSDDVLEVGYHKACRGCDCECGKFTDAGMFRSDAHLY